MIHNLYKNRGETPLECIKRFVSANPKLKGEKMTYLGRLDPLAEGVLLVGSGEDTSQKRREEFFGLDKEYDFVSLFGFATDTYDILGKILRVEIIKNLNEMDLIKIAKIYEGEREQKYPEYSSRIFSFRKSFSSESPRVSLLTQARLSSENFFSKKITIHKLQFHGLETLNNKQLFGRLLMDISKVKGDFRQHEILVLWKKFLLGSVGSKPSSLWEGGRGVGYFLARFSAHVSSGTYIRRLVDDIGNTLGIGATTLSIKRTRVGDYHLKDSIVW